MFDENGKLKNIHVCVLFKGQTADEDEDVDYENVEDYYVANGCIYIKQGEDGVTYSNLVVIPLTSILSLEVRDYKEED